MEQNIKLQLISTEHGFDNFDVIGHLEIRRVTIGHNLERGDVFNVYGPESTKRGATWRGTVEMSLASFLLLSADTIEVSREIKFSHEAFWGEALNGDGQAWGVKENGLILYEAMFCEGTARRLAQLSSLHPDEDWGAISARLESEGFDLFDPGMQAAVMTEIQSGVASSHRG